MLTQTAFASHSRFVTRFIASRLRGRTRDSTIVDDLSQEVWQASLSLTLPDDPDACRRLLAVIASRRIADHARTIRGRHTGSLARKMSGSDSLDTAPAATTTLPCGEWLSAYPENLQYLASHLGNGGSARDLYSSHGQYKVRQDFASLAEFLQSRQNVDTIPA